LPSDWSPVSDSTLTVWEITHHLIRALESSESEAARLYGLMSLGLADQGRRLAYLLFQTSEKRGRAQDAAVYNMLVTAWPQIQRLAAQGEQAAGEKGMFE
jgi:putative DNA methylase